MVLESLIYYKSRFTTLFRNLIYKSILQLGLRRSFLEYAQIADRFDIQFQRCITGGNDGILQKYWNDTKRAIFEVQVHKILLYYIYYPRNWFLEVCSQDLLY